MSDIELRKSLFLPDTYVGSVRGADHASAAAVDRLSGRLQRGVEQLDHSTSHLVRSVDSGLSEMGSAVDRTADAIVALEASMGLALAEQTVVLTQQVDLLTQIRDALVSPARTRAIERVSDAGRLLARGRYDRALALSEQAIDEDPNNGHAFRAAAWALFGLDRLETSQKMFEEAADAFDGDQRSEAARQAARIAFSRSDYEHAHALLISVTDASVSPRELAFASFDLARYAARTGRYGEASLALVRAVEQDTRFFGLATLDDTFKNLPQVTEQAEALYGSYEDAFRNEARNLVDSARRLQLAVSEINVPHRYSDLATRWRPAEDPRKNFAEISNLLARSREQVDKRLWDTSAQEEIKLVNDLRIQADQACQSLVPKLRRLVAETRAAIEQQEQREKELEQLKRKYLRVSSKAGALGWLTVADERAATLKQRITQLERILAS